MIIEVSYRITNSSVPGTVYIKDILRIDQTIGDLFEYNRAYYSKDQILNTAELFDVFEVSETGIFTQQKAYAIRELGIEYAKALENPSDKLKKIIENEIESIKVVNIRRMNIKKFEAYKRDTKQYLKTVANDY